MTTELFRPVGQAELDLIEQAGWREYPPRLPHQPIFYPVTNRAYAEQIAPDWNTKDEASGFVGYVTRFEVNSEYVSRFERKVVGGSEHEELWVPAEELEEFNKQIIGTIEVVAEFRAEAQSSQPNNQLQQTGAKPLAAE